MQLLNIGYNNLINIAHLISITAPESAPVKRIITEARARQMLIDATFGRKTAAVLTMTSDHVVLSALAPDKLRRRLERKEEEIDE